MTYRLRTATIDKDEMERKRITMEEDKKITHKKNTTFKETKKNEAPGSTFNYHWTSSFHSTALI